MAEMNITEVLKYLPQRYPIVMIDRVKECEPGKRVVAVKSVSVNEPYFQGHFPGNPVMPGVLVLEGMAQTAGTLCIRSMPGQTKPALVYFLTIDKAKFRKPVLPGDVLEFHMNKLKQRKTMWWYHGEAKVRGQVVAEADVGAMIFDT